MKYHEKNQLVDESLALIENGKSLSFVENFLKDKGYFRIDIDKIFFSLKRELSKKYNSKVINSLYGDSLNKNNKEFQHLNDEIVESIYKNGVEEIKSLKKQQIKLMVSAGVGDSRIISKSVDKFFSKVEAVKQIEFIEKSISSELKRQREQNLFVGLGALLIGGGFTVLTYMNTIGNRSILFYGLIIFGIINTFNGLGTYKNNRERLAE